MVAYASSAPPGPACVMAPPLAKNKPVPIAPPIAIMLSCRVPMPRCSSRVSLELTRISPVDARRPLSLEVMRISLVDARRPRYRVIRVMNERRACASHCTRLSRQLSSPASQGPQLRRCCTKYGSQSDLRGSPDPTGGFYAGRAPFRLLQATFGALSFALISEGRLGPPTSLPS